MSWGPLQPARIAFGDAVPPSAPDFGDVYHARAGALAQARHVFIGGNGLPARWAGRARFVVLETGFGLGNNFLATWAAWRQDPRRCSRLHYLAIEKHPPVGADLARAHAGSALPALAAELLANWPPLTPDLHTIDFDGGRVRLLLALGDIAAVLPEWVAQVDAFYLDGFAPDRNPAMWDTWRLRQLPRLAAPGATVATWSVAGAVRQGLVAAGFEVHKAPGFGGKREMTVGRFAPRFSAPPPPGRQPLASGGESAGEVAVIGAGLAGAAVARALAAQGIAVQVFERREAPARETSGNVGGLFHGIVHGHDGPHARWLRAAALRAERVLRPLVEGAAIEGAIAGLLRGEQVLSADMMRALLARLALPDDYVQVQPAALPDGRPAWVYPGGGWVSPASLCRHWLAGDGIRLACDTPVRRLAPAGGGWTLYDDHDQPLVTTAAVVLCNAADAARLLGPAAAGWPLRRVRGQTTLLPADLPGLPALPRPLAGSGYALQLADGRLLCGASSQPDDDDGRLRDADQLDNLAALRRLTGWAAEPALDRLQGRVGWRLQSADRLPLLGPVPAAVDEHHAGRHRLDPPRHAPRQRGLYVLTALGSRGITQAALAGEVLAAWLSGDPVPAPATLLDALDPARFAARVARVVRRGG
ncbi:MAG: FAD-dependent 5-carboxymethylaminomethyl-2-thiouridine(34) oxidoreductase MnmC [Burkholderiaceae bacterium]|nr:FAD-dependent 5-carboxymethylaminomethyl-2-thiouridine(34) oxidoreductase MnmC [Burkholderiaceae bacterium]